VLAWLREKGPAFRTPVLVTGAAADPPETAEFNEPPVVDYLPKPFRLAELLESIRSAVAKNGTKGAVKPGSCSWLPAASFRLRKGYPPWSSPPRP